MQNEVGLYRKPGRLTHKVFHFLTFSHDFGFQSAGLAQCLIPV
jgi:hypothetical protein